MSTILQIRSVRRRSTRAQVTLALGSLICAVSMLAVPWTVGAQSASTSGSTTLSKTQQSSTAQTSWLERLDVLRANSRAGIDRTEIDEFNATWQHSRRTGQSIRTADRLSKGDATLFDDMQRLPDQSFASSDGFRTADLIALPGGDIGLVYTDVGLGFSIFEPATIAPRALFRTSSDGGESWSDPVVLGNEGEYPTDYQWVTLAMTGSGRIVMVDESPNFGQVNGSNNHAYYSDDSGATWTAIDYEETDWLDRVLGPVNGQVWVQGGTAPFEGPTSVEYIASDDGITWSDVQTMLPSLPAGVSSITILDIAQTDETSYIASLQLNVNEPCCSNSIGFSRSTDDGVSWSSPEVYDTGDLFLVGDAKLDADGEGNVYLVFRAIPDPEARGADVFIAMSTDGGNTFSAPEAFTRYVGEDGAPAQAYVDDHHLVVFQSERGNEGYRSALWSGIPFTTPDLDPAPVADIVSFNGGWRPANTEYQTVQIRVLDESGVGTAAFIVRRGEEETTLPLFDDGAHGDEEAGDGVFAGTAGPYPYGESIEFIPIVTDDGGNTGYGNTLRVMIAADHQVGNLVAVLSPEGAFGSEMIQETYPAQASGRFPKEDGFAHVAYAGLWVGINEAPGKRVSHAFYDNIFADEGIGPEFADWQVTEYPVEVSGESELDIVMRYDDSGAPFPIGLDIKQTTYQWSLANYIIFDYEITNSSGDDLTDLFVSMVVDPDMPIGGDFFDDVIGYDADRALIYARDSGNWCTENDPSICTDTHLGIALLSDTEEAVAKSVPTPHTATRWTGFSPPFDPERNRSGLDPDMYDLMTSGIWAGFNLGLETNPEEWRMLLTAQPIDLAAGETRRFVFGLVAGAGADGIKASTDAMTDRFERAVLAAEQTSDVPTEFALGQNYPNPFNPSTTIPFSVESTSPVSLTVFDVLGREVGRIVNETLSAGTYTATFESRSLPSGAYYYTLTADGQSITKSMFLLK